MGKKILFIIIVVFLSVNSFGQSRNDILLRDSNTWAVGGGFSNFIMHGDLRSIGTGTLGNFYNFGGYLFVDKMFNPILGLELKLNYNRISGGSQYLSDIYEVLYLPDAVVRDNTLETVDRERLLFRGRSYGAELNFIFSFTNLYRKNAYKWLITGYFGVGYHQYNSALYERLDDGTDFKFDDADFGNNPTRNSVNEASSIYLTSQLGIKRRISRRIDLEARTGIYFNNEDHLDATISNKQDWEMFFVTQIGVIVKLGDKKIHTIWGKQKDEEEFKIIDTDNDGVMDQLDIEPNTPKGVMVYGNGKAVDADGDGTPDHEDQCPLKHGPIANKGCPISKDTDKDGIIDENDLCPKESGPIENKGCPIQEKPKEPKEQEVTIINQQISVLATSIYFDTNSDKIKSISYPNLDKISELMQKIPEASFTIEGHTDDRNSDRYNLYLSQRRAASVRKYIAKSGVDAKKLKSVGYGESRPKYSNATAGGRQLNRRVEIKPAEEFFTEKKLQSESNTHTVQTGETLFSIAKKYKLSVDQLKKLNNLTSDTISKGQVLKLK